MDHSIGILSRSESDSSSEVAVMADEPEVSNLIDKLRLQTEDQERNYQAALLELAKRRNLIICLPTGSGKTYIALQLAKHYLPAAIEHNKLIVFLATTVPLVHQQAAYFRRKIYNNVTGSSIGVRPFTGDMNVDNWSRSKWLAELQNYQIIVLTPQVFLDMILHFYVKFNQVLLLILDECHHAGKDHPMSKIMEQYRKYSQECAGDSGETRILGLTATIIRGLGDVNNIAQEVAEIESIMNCRAITYHDYEEVLKYSTNAELEYVKYSNTISEIEAKKAEWLLGPLRKLISFFLSEEEFESRPKFNSPSPVKGTIYSKKKPSTHELIKTLKDVIEVHNELGLYCTRLVAYLKMALMAARLEDENGDPREGLKRAQRLLVNGVLVQLVSRVDRIIGEDDRSFQLSFVSPKVKALTELFMQFRPSSPKDDSKEDLCGITFVQLRLTAQILCWYYQDVAKYGGIPSKFLSPAFVIGSSANPADIKEARVTSKKQAEVVQLFHEKKCNIVFATSVLEEGLDVPSCNLVVRFDEINSYPSYVQSMGRARKRGARFCVLAGVDNADKLQDSCEKFKSYNGALSQHLKNFALHLEDDDDNTSSPADDDDVPPFCPNGPGTMPRVTMSSAIALVHQYCSMLPADRFASLRPISWWANVPQPDGTTLVQAFLRFPRSAVVKTDISGPPMADRKLAKRAVHLEACKRLYENGGLDSHLMPVRNPLPRDVLNFLREMERGEGDTSDNQSHKKYSWYPKKMPAFLSSVVIEPTSLFDVFIIDFRTKRSDQLAVDSIYDFASKSYRYGLILPKKIGSFGGFEIEGKFGKLNTNFEKVILKGHECGFTAEELSKMKVFHTDLFEKLLGLKLSCAYSAVGSPLYIVPLLKGQSSGSYEIAWEIMNSAHGIDESTFHGPLSEDEVNNLKEIEDLSDSIMVPWYRGDVFVMHNVMSTLPKVTICSEMDETRDHATYFEYFRKKYNITPRFKHQPLLKCTLMARQLNFLSRKHELKKASKEEQKLYKEQELKLVPEYCRRYPFPSSLWVQGRLMPSVLHRVHRLLLAEELKFEVAAKFTWTCATEPDYLNNFGDQGSDDMKQLALRVESLPSPSKVISDHDIPKPDPSSLTANGVGDVLLDSEAYLDFVHPTNITVEDIDRIRACRTMKKNLLESEGDYYEVETKPPSFQLFDIDDTEGTVRDLDKHVDFSVHKGPNAYTIMEALTLANANDGISMERLELIGDSFLKYVVTVQLYYEFPLENEGVLTQIRSKLISNKYLSKLAKAKGLGEYLSGGIFDPIYTWLPPGYRVLEGLCEAAAERDLNISAFYGTPMEELKVMAKDERMKLLELNGNCLNGAPQNTTYEFSRMGNKCPADCVEALIGAYFTNGGQASGLRFMEWIGMRMVSPPESGGTVKFGSWKIPLNIRNDEELRLKSVFHFIPFIKDLEKLICYKFNDPWLLVEAFTHSSYTSNYVTGCYQRLEFLGDAVLDFLVTTHIFHAPRMGPKLTPGELTDLRSALVNNITFGSLAVRYGLHKYLLAVSSELQDSINLFEGYQEEREHKVTGHFKLLNEMTSLVAEDVEVPKVLGDIFESLAGAVYLDCGMSLDTTWKIFYRLMRNEIDLFSIAVPKSPIREIHEAYPGNVHFKSLDRELKERVPTFHGTMVRLTVNGKNYFGVGPNKASAKSAAAKYALDASSLNSGKLKQ